jgi:hypothetical protein
MEANTSGAEMASTAQVQMTQGQMPNPSEIPSGALMSQAMNMPTGISKVMEMASQQPTGIPQGMGYPMAPGMGYPVQFLQGTPDDRYAGVKGMVSTAINSIEAIKQDPELSYKIESALSPILASMTKPLTNIKREYFDPVTTYAPAPKAPAKGKAPAKASTKKVAPKATAKATVKKVAKPSVMQYGEGRANYQSAGSMNVLPGATPYMQPPPPPPAQSIGAPPPPPAQSIGAPAQQFMAMPSYMQGPTAGPATMDGTMTMAQAPAQKTAARPPTLAKSSAKPGMIATTKPSALNRALTSLTNIENKITTIEASSTAVSDTMGTITTTLGELLEAFKAGSAGADSEEVSENEYQEGGRRRRKTRGRGKKTRRRRTRR